jgi:hypothetical protein
MIRAEHLRVILEALHRAVDEVDAAYKEIVCQGSEPEISALVEARLYAYLVEPEFEPGDPPALLGMWRQLVHAVARGKESVGHDGRRIELRPDLNIFLTNGHPSFPLVVECKLIDLTGGRTVGMYLDNGVLRFLIGDYAWAMQEAIMLTYVRDGSRVAETLAPPIAECDGAKYAVLRQLEIMPRTPVSFARPDVSDIANSVHARRFRYRGRTPPEDDPGAISIWHLWVPVCKNAA